MRANIYRFATLIAFALLLAIPIKSLAQHARTAKNPKRVDKVVKQGGWDIPGFSADQLITTSDIAVGDRMVTLRGYRLKDSVESTLDLYSLDPNNALLLRSRDVELETVGSYSVDNRIFAYQVICVPLGTAQDGSKAHIGVMIRVFYFDEDGDGLFESRYISDKIPNFLPAWIGKKK